MIRRSLVLLAVVLVLITSTVTSLSAQLFGGVVYDPTNYGNALLRYAQLQQQLAQLVLLYQQVRTHYQLFATQTQRLPFNMGTRYRLVPTLWTPLTAADRYRTAGGWITAANTGRNAAVGYALATQTLQPYGGSLNALAAEEAARVRLRYDRVQLVDASIAHALEALGGQRDHQVSVDTAIRRLEDDAHAADPALNTQIAVLNKINATTVTSTRLANDTNNLLIALLEHELLAATERREGIVQGINAHVAFLADARPLLARTTALTTNALTTFRIP
jgi:hypothetical protein